jgi:hypothetical protein
MAISLSDVYDPEHLAIFNANCDENLDGTLHRYELYECVKKTENAYREA